MLLLFKHIEEVAASNPKYEHMVRLENYHFFSATIRPLKVSGLPVGRQGRARQGKARQADSQVVDR